MDGMYARVIYSWPRDPKYRPLTNEVAEIEPEIVNALKRIAEMEAGLDQDGGFAPRAVQLSQAATEHFEHFRQFLHDLKQGLDGRERDWIAKGQAHTLRLAGTLCFLDWAMRGGPEPTQIEAQFMEAAIRLVHEYFWPHTRACLRQIGLTERHVNARRVLRWIKAKRLSEVSVREIRRDALRQSLDMEQTLSLLLNLEKYGWLREITVKTGARGRPSRRWLVNPKLHAENAENASMPAP